MHGADAVLRRRRLLVVQDVDDAPGPVAVDAEADAPLGLLDDLEAEDTGHQVDRLLR
ncbi:hypothetical protein D3C83_288780 [compost metagenome]